MKGLVFGCTFVSQCKLLIMKANEQDIKMSKILNTDLILK